MAAPLYSRSLANYKFLQMRHRAYVRHKAQCAFRGEGFELTVEDWQQFWPTELQWQRRGRSRDDLMMTRVDPELPWSKTNCCLVTRIVHFDIRARRRRGDNYEQLFQQAIFI